jgi:murein DD-endopeptidase MepM/ murein hydrolase activator NlpD
VILDLGGGRYAFDAHLQPGTIRVKPGDRVRTGQILDLVGNSGNSTEPHLHFHLPDGNPPCTTRSSWPAVAARSPWDATARARERGGGRCRWPTCWCGFPGKPGVKPPG